MTSRFDYEFKFDNEYNFLETFRFDYEYDFLTFELVMMLTARSSAILVVNRGSDTIFDLKKGLRTSVTNLVVSKSLTRR